MEEKFVFNPSFFSRIMSLPRLFRNISYLITIFLLLNISIARDYIEPSNPNRDGECDSGLILDCNNNCYPESFLVFLNNDFCDDGTYQFGGVDIYFNCDTFNNDEGDCDGNFNRQQNQQQKYPNGRIPFEQ